jgi:ribosomal protein S18 acetylase RimI-like enzyme
MPNRMQRVGSLRAATAEDVGAVRAVVDAAYAVYVPRIGRPPAPMTADHAALIAGGAVSVIERDGEVVGVLVVHALDDHLLVENVAVAPAHQGTGLGRMLLAEAERLARERGLGEVRLYTNRLMVENLEMYPRLGYRETGRSTQHGYARVHFAKRVGPAG